MPKDQTRDELTQTTDASPPVGGSWMRLYVVVLLTLFVLVALFYIFTRAFG